MLLMTRAVPFPPLSPGCLPRRTPAGVAAARRERSAEERYFAFVGTEGGGRSVPAVLLSRVSAGGRAGVGCPGGPAAGVRPVCGAGTPVLAGSALGPGLHACPGLAAERPPGVGRAPAGRAAAAWASRGVFGWSSARSRG